MFLQQVRRSKLKNFISFWKRTKISQKYYLIKSYGGASVFYSYERRFLPSSARKHRPKFLNKYYLKGKDHFEEQFYRPDSRKVIPLFIPSESYFG